MQVPPLIIALFLVLTAPLMGCGASARTHDAPPPGPSPDGYEFVLRALPPESGGAFLVTLIIGDDGRVLPDPFEVSFPDVFAGRTGFGEDVQQVSAESAQQEPLPIRWEESRAFIQHGGATALRVTYRVAPSRRLVTEESRFRAVMGSRMLFAPGHALIAQPLSLGSAPLGQVRLDVQEGAEWAVRSTLGHATVASIEDLVDAAFFAGEFREYHTTTNHRELSVFVAPGASEEPGAVAESIERIVDSQAELLGPSLAHETHVVVLPRDDDAHAFSGSGRSGGFVIELGDSVNPRSSELCELIAHENLHRLNGHDLRFAARDELATLWFKEGATEYLAVLGLAQAGVIEPRRFFGMIGRSITSYRGNPRAHDTAVGRLDYTYWSDRDARRLPYDKGALLALLIDLRLRIEHGRTLHGFLVFLRDDDATRALPLSSSSLRDALSRYSNSSWDDFWSAYVEGTELLPVFDQLDQLGLEVVERLQPAPYFGFRASMSTDGNWFVSEVAAGSPASQMGLRAGQELAAEPFIPERNIEQSAQLVVVDGRGTRSMSIPPARGQRRAFALVLAADSDDSYLSWFGLRAPPN